ncbi:MAG: transcription termination factor NusA [Candidatus Andersenbacteria bacterium]
MADEQPTFGSAIDQIVAEKGISKEKVLETIEAALAAAYRKDYGERGQDIRAEFNEDDGTARIFKVVTVVADEAVENPAAQLGLIEAQKEDPEAVVDKEYVEEVTPTDPNYGRVAAQTAKQVIIQRIREAEREAVFDEYKEKEGEIISGIVQRIEGDTVFVDIGRTTGILFPSEQVQGERYRVNQRIRVYVVKVDLSSRGPEILVSRSHPGMLRRLFELEVPEIFAGSVEIKAIAREASQRSKIAVWAKEEGIDPVGACIGQRGTRIQTIIAELSGEKIDIIQWDEDPARFIANALSPAKVVAVDVYEEEKRAVAHVEEYQLSLAIGKKGQNVRLAAKLTGWRIDILKAGADESQLEAGATPEEANPLADHAPAAVPTLPAGETPAADQAEGVVSVNLPPADTTAPAPEEQSST